MLGTEQVAQALIKHLLAGLYVEFYLSNWFYVEALHVNLHHYDDLMRTCPIEKATTAIGRHSGSTWQALTKTTFYDTAWYWHLKCLKRLFFNCSCLGLTWESRERGGDFGNGKPVGMSPISPIVLTLWSCGRSFYVSHMFDWNNMNPISCVSHRFRCNILVKKSVHLRELEGMGEQGSKADHNQLGKGIFG